jgi:isopentenyl-diphosphate Delta-isomerase
MDDVRNDHSAASAGASADADALILVDEADCEVGHMSRAQCHYGRGILHRAFSLLVFNHDGELLLQRRAASKRLWPLYWSNSCCSHPRRGETMESAIHRRLHEELGIRCALRFLFKFQYQAQFDDAGAENELCSVFIGRTAERVKPDPHEIADARWIGPEALSAEMAARGPGYFTPWFALEWERICRDHRDAVIAMRHPDAAGIH